MPKYVIERDIPGAGKMNPSEMLAVARKARDIVTKLGPDIQWVQSYVTKDKVYCVYIANSPDIILRHAREGGFPANNISEVNTILDPALAA
ncbi:MAG: DUF4242 domain-containing protein [Bdellovibrionota bacterium]